MLTGEFTYLAPTVEASLHRNGKVFTRRDGSGNDNASVGADLQKCRMPVEDARPMADRLSQSRRLSRPERTAPSGALRSDVRHMMNVTEIA